MIFSPAGFVFSADCLEVFISRCVCTATKRRANGKIQIKEAKMWWVTVLKNKQRTALSGRQLGRNNRKENGRIGSKSSHANVNIQKTWKSGATSACCIWSSVGAPYWTHMLQRLFQMKSSHHKFTWREYLCCIVPWNPIPVSPFPRIRHLGESSERAFMLRPSPFRAHESVCVLAWLLRHTVMSFKLHFQGFRASMTSGMLLLFWI